MLEEYCNNHYIKKLFPIHNSYHCEQNDIRHVIKNEYTPYLYMDKLVREINREE